MNWSDTRKKLLQLAARRPARRVLGPPSPFGRAGRGDVSPALSGGARAPLWFERVEEPVGSRVHDSPERLAEDRTGRSVRAASLCVASGKGGTGKSVVTASLAALFSPRGRTLVVDADLGVGNAHILQDVSPPHTFVDVVEGSLSVREVLVPCSEQVDLLAAGSGVPRMADLSSFELHLIANGLEELELEYRYLLVDSAAGVSRQTMSFARACDQTVIVTTPDLTAMTDAYAFLKVLIGGARPRPLLLVNKARDEEQAREVTDRIVGVCERFLGAGPQPIGWIPYDPTVKECVNQRGSVVHLAPEAEASRALRRVAVSLLQGLTSLHPRGLGRRLLDDAGYSSRLT
jgi:flagellar biosynthesis protein FlhG